jgi:glycosyltransferase involved in cell wall biosynthesis
MISNKVLFFCNYPIVQNAGGPVGYFNKCIINNNPKNTILSNDISIKNVTLKDRINIHYERFFNKKSEFLPHANSQNLFIKKKVCNYKLIYFHDIFSLYNVLHLLNNKQIVVLQSHTPELPSREAFNDGVSKEKYNKIKEIEIKAFNRANYIVLPNIECKIIYNQILNKNNKILELTTGIKKVEELSKFPICNKSINLLYIGRRNSIKGFDFLINEFKEICKFRKDLNLFIAGDGEKVVHEKIFDIGKTDKAYDWINSVDFVISLNKTSYFDLNIIETISIGTPLIMTTTEGHTFFKNKKGIIDVNYENFKEVILNSNDISKEFKKENKQNLLDFHKNELSDSIYKQNLEIICNKIIEENV